MILVLLFVTVYAASNRCSNSRTHYYLNHSDSQFYIPSTISRSESCRVITISQYKDLYPWVSSPFNIDYIVDVVNGPEELSDCDLIIAANMIASHSQWNRELSGMCWKDVELEK